MRTTQRGMLLSPGLRRDAPGPPQEWRGQETLRAPRRPGKARALDHALADAKAKKRERKTHTFASLAAAKGKSERPHYQARGQSSGGPCVKALPFVSKLDSVTP